MSWLLSVLSIKEEKVGFKSKLFLHFAFSSWTYGEMELPADLSIAMVTRGLSEYGVMRIRQWRRYDFESDM